MREMELSVSMLESSLALVQRHARVPPRRQNMSFALMLAVALERMMKLVLCQATTGPIAALPTPKELRRLDQPLGTLREMVVAQAFTPDYLRIPAAAEDHAFLQDDATLALLLRFLAEVGQSESYIHLATFGNTRDTSGWLEQQWETVERQVLGLEIYHRYVQERRLREFRQESVRQIVACLERCARALCRLFIVHLGRPAGSNVATVWGFIRMTDAQFGQRQYQER